MSRWTNLNNRLKHRIQHSGALYFDARNPLHLCDKGAQLIVLRAGVTYLMRFGKSLDREPATPLDREPARALFDLLPVSARKPFFKNLYRVMAPRETALRKDKRFDNLFSSPPDFDDIVTFLRYYPDSHQVLHEGFQIEVERLERNIASHASPFMKKLEEVKSTFRLSPIEAHIVALGALYQLSKIMECLVDSLPRCRHGRRMQLKLFEFLDANRLDMLKYASPEGALQKLGLLDRDGDIRGEVVEFLVGGRREPLTSSYFDRFKGPSLPLEKLMIVKKDVETIRTLLSNRKPKQGINILLAGPPGTGKTETVHSLAKELGLNLFEIASMQKRHDGDGDIGQSNDYFRMRALVACRYAFGDYPDTAVLIDESDSLLGGGGSRSLFGPSRSSLGKAMINDGLDTAVCPQFWIANDIDGIDPSTRRRFDYAIRYERPTPKDRVSIWETAANKHGMAGLLRPEDLERFAREWPVSAGGIDSALRNAARVPKKAMTRSEFVAYINRLIESQLLFTEEEGKAETVRAASEEQVAIEMLNIEPAANLKCILEVVARWREAPEKRGLNILLQGPPGTGKTHFARRLAELLGRPLHAKTGSEILSPYVGMTEKTIREVFRQAGRESAVLFLDEIDSLLSSREKAVRSWEVTQVNELLSALESFDGVFVAATNHVSTLDSASMRRFHFQLEFGPLTPAGAETFYRDLLAGFAGGDVPAGVAAQLRRLTGLVPSDFANVRKRLTLVPGMTATHDELLGGLADMCKARFPRRKQAIGFNNNG